MSGVRRSGPPPGKGGSPVLQEATRTKDGERPSGGLDGRWGRRPPFSSKTRATPAGPRGPCFAERSAGSAGSVLDARRIVTALAETLCGSGRSLEPGPACRTRPFPHREAMSGSATIRTVSGFSRRATFYGPSFPASRDSECAPVCPSVAQAKIPVSPAFTALQAGRYPSVFCACAPSIPVQEAFTRLAIRPAAKHNGRNP